MKIGEVKINLKNLDGIDEGEYIVSDGVSHRLYSPWLRANEQHREINRGQLEEILRDHSNFTIAMRQLNYMETAPRGEEER